MSETQNTAVPFKLVINWTYLDNISRRVELIEEGVGSLMKGSYFARPITQRMITFLTRHGVCAACARPVAPNLTACTCAVTPRLGGHLDIRITGPAEDEFHQLLRSETETYRTARRRKISQPASGALTEQEVALLLDLQDGLCFYCAEEFQGDIHGPVFHRDHYQSVANGGMTTLENTVLACPACNIHKDDLDGYTFECRMRSRRIPSLKLRYSKMRRRFRTQLRQLGRDHAALLTRVSTT